MDEKKGEHAVQDQSEPSSAEENGSTTRRGFFASLAMAAGLVLSYGALTVKGLLFVLPPKTSVRRRKLYAGRLDQYKPGAIQTFIDLEGKKIMVKRSGSGIKAFSSVCPHLGCAVEWQDGENRFFCPCHGGVFNEDGKPLAGPPADGDQWLNEVPVSVDESSGIVYIEVKDVKGRAG